MAAVTTPVVSEEEVISLKVWITFKLGVVVGGWIHCFYHRLFVPQICGGIEHLLGPSMLRNMALAENNWKCHVNSVDLIKKQKLVLIDCELSLLLSETLKQFISCST